MIYFEDDLEKILQAPALIKNFNHIEGDALKTVPRGFEKTHPRAELLKLKQFIFSQNLNDKAIIDHSVIKTIKENYKSLQPFLKYMTSVLTTDANGEPLF